MIRMIHSEKFKSRLVGKMTGPGAVSANSLAADVGLSQTTLSRWLREARTVPGMSKKSRGSKKTTSSGRSQDWSVEEKSRIVVESRELSEEALGAFLRQEGLHQAQLEEWTEAMYSGLSASKKSKTASEDAKRIKKLERELRRKEKALAEAQSDGVRARLDADSETAIARGVFGVPSLFVGDRMFWGNDRYELIRHFIEKGTAREGSIVALPADQAAVIARADAAESDTSGIVLRAIARSLGADGNALDFEASRLFFFSLLAHGEFRGLCLDRFRAGFVDAGERSQ